MIKQIAVKITDFMFKNIRLNSELFEVYKYGVEITLSTLLNIILILTASIVVSDIISGIVFLAVFILLRSFVGGYHAKTYFMCNALFLLTYLLIYYINSVLVQFIEGEFLSKILTVLIFLGIIPIIAFAPVENPNKPLSKKQAQINRIMGIAVFILLSIVGLALYYNGIKYGSFSIIALTSVSVLILIEIIKHGGKKKVLKEKVAKAIASVSLKMAKVCHGAASGYGMYQPKEPEAIKKLRK